MSDMKAVVQIPMYHEPEPEVALEAISSQQPPPGWDVEFEAWVTPRTAHPRDDGTYLAAESVAGIETFEVPGGKLTARNRAHDHAVGNGADVVVTWDADAPPLHDDALANLLEPYSDPDVVATVGEPVPPPSVIGTALALKKAVQRPFTQQIHGQLSSFRSGAWEAAGPFATDLRENSLLAVWMEEEFKFGHRLRQQGRVEYVHAAEVRDDTRRWACRLSEPFAFSGREPPARCRSMGGAETFEVGENIMRPGEQGAHIHRRDHEHD